MDTASLKSFATWARSALIREVEARMAGVLAPGSTERVEQPKAVSALEKQVNAAGGGEEGRSAVADRVAYTWFNRIIALRFMDANGYTGVSVVSPHAGAEGGQPEILADAKRGHIDLEVVGQATRERVLGLLDGTRKSGDPQGEAYALLLTEYCHHWHRSMPFMFEREGDFTELLIPADLLAEESVLNRAVAVLTEDVCRDVEVIGWLYQFYISERKDEIFDGFRKNNKAGADELPAATQLFTPHWIVRYLVENSLGRLWMLNRPASQLVEQMDYYIHPVEEETDFLKVTSPEELTVMDPACGSGHMLTYAFDLLYAIYEEEGYAPSEIPGLILTRNLHGTEIDPRAGALAAFALTMKARAKQRTFFNKRIEPNVCVIDSISFSSDELDFLVTRNGDKSAQEAFWNQFVEADTFGSLIQPDPDLTVRLSEHLATLSDEGDILRADTLDWAHRVIDQAIYLTGEYAVVVANPPYMGSKQMNALLSQFMKDEYPDAKSDLFAGFISRCTNLAGPQGTVAMITMQSWMFLSSYEKLRASLVTKQHVSSMLHLGSRAFNSIGGEVVSSTAFVVDNVLPEARAAAHKRAGTFIRLVDGTSEAEKIAALDSALVSRTKEAGFHLAADSDFSAIPGSPIVYWLSEKMRGAFAIGSPLSDVANLRQGLATADNNRFLRQWWEVSRRRTAFACTSREEAAASGARWFPYNKGGEFRKWYGNHEYVVNWEDDGAEITEFKPRSVIRNPGTYFSPSVSWSKVSSGAPAFRVYPAGFIYDVAGTSIFAATGRERAGLLAFANSQVALEQLAAIAPTLNYEVGQVAGLPVADATADIGAVRAVAAIDEAKADWDGFETSWEFARNPLVALSERG